MDVGKVPVYNEDDDTPDLRTLDLEEIHQMKIDNEERIKELRKKAQEEEDEHSKKRKEKQDKIEKFMKQLEEAESILEKTGAPKGEPEKP